MKLFAALASLLLLVARCSAQDASSGTDQASDQSVVAAAKASRARVQIEQAKEADIRRLLDLTGSASLAIQAMSEMEKNIRPLISDSLPRGEYREKLVGLFFEKFHSKLNSNQLLDLVIPIYDKYYTHEDIKELIQLYQTPLGKKMLVVLPKVMGESQAAGTKWGETMGRESMMEVMAEHPEMEKAIEAAKKNPPAQ